MIQRSLEDVRSCILSLEESTAFLFGIINTTATTSINSSLPSFFLLINSYIFTIFPSRHSLSLSLSLSLPIQVNQQERFIKEEERIYHLSVLKQQAYEAAMERINYKVTCLLSAAIC